MKVTIAQFYRVSGWSTQNRGVETSLVLPSLYNARDIGESTLDNALPWRSIDQVSYRVSGNLKKVLPKLKQLSENRIANSEFFQKVKEDVQEYLTTIKPLKYTSILKMQEDDLRRKTQRDQELESASEKVDEDNSDDTEIEEEKKEIQLDEYMKESLEILSDYIKLQKK